MMITASDANYNKSRLIDVELNSENIGFSLNYLIYVSKLMKIINSAQNTIKVEKQLKDEIIRSINFMYILIKLIIQSNIHNQKAIFLTK